MGTDFFKLDTPFSTFQEERELLDHFSVSDHLKNVLYEPPVLQPGQPQNRIKGKTFENVSLSKTHIVGVAFTECKFKNCLFIGTHFEGCEFHRCSFERCNPYKIRFENTYIAPGVFANLLDPREHSNIGVSLFQELMQNSRACDQPYFARTAEYFFKKWRRYQMVYEWRRDKKTHVVRFMLRWFPNWAYDIAAGYGLRAWPLLRTSVLLFAAILLLNHFMWLAFGMTGTAGSTSSTPDWIRSFYYTAVTLTTLGYGDVVPSTRSGMLVVGCEGILGVVWFAVLASSIVKRIVR